MNTLKIRTAFILGAGLGTRLRPLTDACPKPLLPVGGRPLITYVMDHLLSIGIERFIVNTHHCPDAYDEAFPERSWRGWPVLFRHEPVLLETAGGLKNIEDLLTQGETILVCNGDILSDLPLRPLLAAHASGGREVTLVLRSDGPVTNVALDPSGVICDMRDLLGNPGIRRCCFTGIYLVEKRFLRRLTPGRIESVVPIFVEMISKSPGSVGSAVIDAGIWEDVGDPQAYARIAAAPVKLNYERGKMAPGKALPDSPVGRSGADDPTGEAIAIVRRVLDLSADTAMTLGPVGRGGSDRDYFRVSAAGCGPAILMRYSRVREENNHYAAIAGFLREIGVAVPAILGHDPGQGLLLMEDLGDGDLFACREAPWEVRRGLYEKTLALAARLHAFAPEQLPEGVRLMPGFGPDLYRWERDYFREQCVRKACGIRLTDPEEEALETELAGLARRLMETPPVLVHRDLQSQNVMIRKGEPVFIDFQGMRPGNPFYDLGSLLYDPYVEFREKDRDALLRYYYDLSPSGYGWEAFRTCFFLASAQRLMQALGAYGFLGIEKKKAHFLLHIPTALERLAETAGLAGTLSRLGDLARRCREAFG